MQNSIITSIISTLGVLALAGSILGATVLSLPRVDSWIELKQTEVRNQAIDGCAEVSLNTFNSEGNVISDINQKTYQDCLELKGVSQK